MVESTLNAADILYYGHRTLHQSLDDLPIAAWETGGVCGIWSVKDIVSHLTSYELMLIDVLTGFVGGGETPVLDQMLTLDPDEFNRIQVEGRRDMPSRDVVTELDIAHERVLTLARQIPPEIWREAGTLPWYGAEYSLDDFIAYSFYGHKREHSAQVNVFKDVLKQNS